MLTAQGLKTTVVRIVDKCPDNHCGIDLGGTAPSAVMADGFGRYADQWRLVACGGHPGGRACACTTPPPAAASIDYQDTGGSAHGRFPFDASNAENA